MSFFLKKLKQQYSLYFLSRNVFLKNILTLPYNHRFSNGQYFIKNQTTA